MRPSRRRSELKGTRGAPGRRKAAPTTGAETGEPGGGGGGGGGVGRGGGDGQAREVVRPR